MLEDTVRQLMKEGAKEVILKTDEGTLHFIRVGNSVVQIDKATGTVLSEFPL